MRFGPKMYDEDGRAVPGSRGYKYFGRARELPGVKELFEDLQAKPKDVKKDEERKQRAEMRKNVDADYYGYNRDEEDGVLLAYERRKEQEALAATEERGGEPQAGWECIPDGWKVPTLEDVTEFLVEKRKSRLLQRLG